MCIHVYLHIYICVCVFLPEHDIGNKPSMMLLHSNPTGGGWQLFPSWEHSTRMVLPKSVLLWQESSCPGSPPFVACLFSHDMWLFSLFFCFLGGCDGNPLVAGGAASPRTYRYRWHCKHPLMEGCVTHVFRCWKINISHPVCGLASRAHQHLVLLTGSTYR